MKATKPKSKSARINYCGCQSRFYLNRTFNFDAVTRKWADIMRGIGDLRNAAKTIDLIEDYCLL